ncbi:MAG: D-TA family PLP-dependent enzyme [Gemmatimonadaceae bacterium]|nr:D-TA family PLP-dependent enzyme [Gemmatimonadaceae bacterium]NUQ94878.1 D-TA family PLP-dependent enzyme [Gemmatimonadaceae bacterium]NUR21182.1 D-TA family PLP-dependent enzyme [Gemmatimonadaceae bacterium]NUS98975.1 D-TA family PLP-dependent enzyme [Gemmatimonadaceae bacterium]
MKHPPGGRRAAFPRFPESPPPQSVTDLETPAAVVDLDRLATNLEAMATYSALHGLSLRPHVKTHKSPRIAAEQVRLGAAGLTCATTRELEVMADVSRDLLLAYPPIGSAKLARLMTLPRETRITVAVDSATAIEQLASTARVVDREIAVYIEIDVGMRRVGVATPEEAVELARQVWRSPPLRYAGIAFYPGQIRESVSEQGPAIERLNADLGRTVRALERQGLTPPAVSGGSTPAAWRMHEVEGLTEVRPGTYVYNDRVTAAIGACSWDDCALTVAATVISTAVPGQVVIDAGTKALGREPMRGAEGEGYGALLDRPELVVSRMSEEHGIIELGDSDWRPKIGEIVRVVPNHVCIVVNLFDEIHGVRNDVVETSWPVEARGRGPVPRS